MAAPNNHRNGFARKNGRRPVETGACRAREAIVCDVYPDEKQEAMLEPLAKFQERFDRAFFRALRELEKLQKIRRQTAPPPVKEAPPAFTEPRPSGSGTPPEPGYPLGPPIGVKISYAELRLVGEDCWPASGILMNCAGDRDSPRFVSIAKRPCLGRRRVAPTASYEIETRRYADT